VLVNSFAFFKAGQKTRFEPRQADLLIGVAQLPLLEAIVVGAVRFNYIFPAAIVGFTVSVNPVFQTGVIMGLEQGLGPSQPAVTFSDFIPVGLQTLVFGKRCAAA